MGREGSTARPEVAFLSHLPQGSAEFRQRAVAVDGAQGVEAGSRVHLLPSVIRVSRYGRTSKISKISPLPSISSLAGFLARI
jgi:hypothetical protein